ncbi:MAG: Fe-S cluster assembly protein SufD [Bacteroidota bacterium]
MSTIDTFSDRFHSLQAVKSNAGLNGIRQQAFNAFNKYGIPTVKNEEWKYTRISTVFNTDFKLPLIDDEAEIISIADVDAIRLPGNETANELVFVNGLFSFKLSSFRSKELIVLPLEEAASNNEYAAFVSKNLGHSSNYLKDGINAINTALVHDGVFIHVKKGLHLDAPIYIYNITDARTTNVLSQPRSLVYVAERSMVQMVETYATIGINASFTNQVMEVVVAQDAIFEYYKIQNDASHTNQVSTTHIRQIEKSYVHTVTLTLDGGIVRNNLNMVMEADHCESHLYGLYFQQGSTHVDNHTVVDNVMPNCLSNEYYKGILDNKASGVFNGKIFVRKDAQKTNAYQSNKNVLLSNEASVNTKPQLEIFADDVKCSHGCTIGKLDEEGMFYLQSRGISEKIARSLLLHGFVIDLLEKVKLPLIRDYVDQLISERLEYDIS